ncbi:hypothetical protein [Ornithinimicrobium kibberense]|uniref:hypothetical protein n=1 Tax=Ornithinimicrobium kibberense TaxID=282060 RepID=UPI00360CE1B4
MGVLGEDLQHGDPGAGDPQTGRAQQVHRGGRHGPIGPRFLESFKYRPAPRSDARGGDADLLT